MNALIRFRAWFCGSSDSPVEIAKKGNRKDGRLNVLRNSGVVIFPKLAAVTLCLFVACSESPTAPTDPGPEPRIIELPSRFEVEGSALGSEQGRTVECRLGIVFEVGAPGEADPPFHSVYQGTHFGEVERVIDTGDGGYAFTATVGGDAIVRLARSGTVEIEFPANDGAESRFWRSLARLRGSIGPDGEGIGTWPCAPLDIQSGAFDDEVITVEVPWSLTPAD